MGEAALWGMVGASALVIGAEVAFAFQLSRLTIGLIMAFGVGALISSVSFELIAPAIQSIETWQVGLGLASGSIVFFVGDRLIARIGGEGRKDPEGGSEEEGESSGLGIVLGTLLDGVPESAVLGMSLVGGGGVSLSLLAGVWLSNFPESLGGSVNMLRSGWSKGKIRLLWWSILGMSAVAAAIGFAALEASSGLTGGLVEAFAAGALLTMIADEMAPQAYDRAAIYAGLATVAGFGLAVWLTTFE
jgi:ZIP family zinc transporter